MSKIIIFLLGCFAVHNVISMEGEYQAIELGENNQLITITTSEGLYKLAHVLQHNQEQQITYDVQPSAIVQYFAQDNTKDSRGDQMLMHDLTSGHFYHTDYYNQIVRDVINEIQNREASVPEVNALLRQMCQLPVEQSLHVEDEIQNMQDEYDKKRGVYICQKIKNAAVVSAFLIGAGVIAVCSWVINTQCGAE